MGGPIQVQIMSDLHLETPHSLPMYSEFDIEAIGSCLALLGDIGNASDDRLFQFLRRQLEQFEYVFFVLGNHEPYQGPDEPEKCTYEAAVSRMERFQAGWNTDRAVQHADGRAPQGQFVLLNRSRFDLGSTVTILGCTLFSKIAPSQERNISIFVSDFSNIADWTVEKHNAAHHRDLAWLNHEVESIVRSDPDRSIVVFTHYSPTALEEANDPDYLDDPKDVQSAFLTNLENEACWKSSAVKLWAFGHTHYSCDFLDGTGKRIVANQRGYGREDAFDFDADKVWVIGNWE
jgi:hypothetical protein